MPWCDTCNVELAQYQGTLVPHDVVASGIKAGFRPPARRFERASDMLKKPVEDIEAKWVETSLESNTDWRLCDVCRDALGRLLKRDFRLE